MIPLKANRLIEIIFILTERKRVTARELAEKFDVSVRTIYRDIDTLSSSNVPVYTEKGSGGGIFILPNYIFNKAVLSEDEQYNILIALQSLNAIGYPNTVEILDKISNMFNKDNYKWIDVDFTSWGDNEYNQKFDILKSSLMDMKTIQFDYFNTSGEKSTKEVEPIMLLFKYSSWYLQAYCLERQENRMYKVSRMNNLTLTGNGFTTRRKQEDLPVIWGGYTVTINADLLFKKEYAYQVFDDFNPNTIFENEDGTLSVKTKINSNSYDWFYNMLFFYGDNVTVIGDETVLKHYKAYVKKIYGMYF